MTEEEIKEEENVQGRFVEMEFKVAELWGKQHSVDALQLEVERLSGSVDGIKATYSELNPYRSSTIEEAYASRNVRQLQTDFNNLKFEIVQLKHRISDCVELQKQISKEYSLLGAPAKKPKESVLFFFLILIGFFGLACISAAFLFF